MQVSLSYCSLVHIASGLELLKKDVDTWLKPKERSAYDTQEYYDLVQRQYLEIRGEITDTLAEISKTSETWLGAAGAMDKLLGITVAKVE
jgi:hypothetical protein